jgi:hypothetical protein
MTIGLSRVNNRGTGDKKAIMEFSRNKFNNHVKATNNAIKQKLSPLIQGLNTIRKTFINHLW